MIYLVESDSLLSEERKLLLCMPYLIYKGKDFDAQFEELKSKEEIISFLRDILKGEQKTDKYGNTIKINSEEDKTEFIDSLKNSAMFNQMIRSMFTPTEKELLDIILQEF